VTVRGPQVSIARLPVTSRELFGREADLAWLEACWRDRVHVASVVAWGGVGKSALVNAWLAGLRDRKWGGAERVFGWSFYSQGTDRLGSSDEFFAVALQWFGDSEPAPMSPWEKGVRLARVVCEQRRLLVLDGLEPLQWGPGVQEGRLKDPALEALLKELGGQNEGCALSPAGSTSPIWRGWPGRRCGGWRSTTCRRRRGPRCSGRVGSSRTRSCERRRMSTRGTGWR
jgi:hypothetical protein